MMVDIGYAATLFFISGVVLLAIDRPICKSAQMGKERGAAQWLGWIQMSISALIVLFIIFFYS